MSFGFQSLIGSPPRRRVDASMIVALAGFVVGFGPQTAMAQQGSLPGGAAASVNNTGARSSTQNVISGKPLTAKLGKDTPTEYIIAHPTWRESKAVRVVDPNRPQMNIEKTIFSRILVGVTNETVLKNAIETVGAALGSNRPGSHTYQAYLNEAGVYVVQANSVEDAINLANELTKIDGVKWAEVDYQGQVENKVIPTDPSSPNQWHIFNTTGPFFGNDHRVNLVYDRGITGSGVVVGILEAFENSFYRVDEFGTTFIHPDLVNKLNETLSIPTDPFAISYSHGVSVTGLIGGEANNGLAGAGVAYGAQLASLRNGSQIDTGQSFGHELANIDIINNSWGPVLESFPNSSKGKYLVALGSANYEIDIPQVRHAGISRFSLIGIDQGIRLGRARKGRLFVFSAGNSSHFQGFSRLGLGNAISLPGFGIPDGTSLDADGVTLHPTWSFPDYGYLDATGLSPADGDGDGVPDSFLMDGRTLGAPVPPFPALPALGWRWSGLLGDRVNYSEMASNSRTLAIASIGMSNARSGYSTTGAAIFAGAYSQDSTLAQEFTPPPFNTWFPSVSGQGLVTLEQADGIDGDLANGIDCSAFFGVNFVNGDLETCDFNGTSAAAPVASGIFALMLQANPNLTLRDVQHIVQQTSTIVNFDPTNSYWPSIFLGLGALDTDDGSPPTPTFWTTNRAGVRHSDEYGFGILNADAAVQAALTWPGVGALHILDSGTVTIANGDIADATFVQTGLISPNLQTNVLVPGIRSVFALNCVRENFTIEGVEITLTITGDGAGDLLIALVDPYGTVSPLALPRGDSNGLSGTAYNDYTFSTYKHWGELSGGQWNLIIQDFRPDTASPEGTIAVDPQPNPPAPEDFGLEQVTYLGTFGLPGEPAHSTKKLVSYRLKIFGTNDGNPIFEGCPINQTACPADLDGNGVVDVADLQIYISLFLENNPLADIDGDGDVDYNDLMAFRALWRPGFCNATNDPFIGGRPRPGGGGGVGDGDPIINPI